ncbi:MAG: hypothetical protein ACYS6W_01985 [Planctomycetota bacterium]
MLDIKYMEKNIMAIFNQSRGGLVSVPLPPESANPAVLAVIIDMNPEQPRADSLFWASICS